MIRHGTPSSAPSAPSLDSKLYRVPTLAAVTPRPRTRSFIVGRTGSGKSTLAAALLEEYHMVYPRHVLYILDYKERFQPVEPESHDHRLFPEGTRERSFGRRDRVPIVAEHLTRPRYPHPEETAFVIQGQSDILAFCQWQFEHSTVSRPALVYADESEDLMRGDHRAHLPFRRLVKQGREIGTGLVVLNQEPVYVDRTWFTQSEQLYVGRLTQPADREKLMDSSVIPGADAYLDEPLPFFTWLYLDQEHERMALFSLGPGRAGQS